MAGLLVDWLVGDLAASWAVSKGNQLAGLRAAKSEYQWVGYLVVHLVVTLDRLMAGQWAALSADCSGMPTVALRERMSAGTRAESLDHQWVVWWVVPKVVK